VLGKKTRRRALCEGVDIDCGKKKKSKSIRNFITFGINHSTSQVRLTRFNPSPRISMPGWKRNIVF